MDKKINKLSIEEKKVLNRFLSLEIPKQIKINYPTQKVQDIFKLKLSLNEFNVGMRKKKYQKE